MTELDSMTVALQRGLIVTIATSGVYSGKPRPAVVVLANRWLQGHPSVTLCPLTSTLLEAVLVHISVNPSRQAIHSAHSRSRCRGGDSGIRNPGRDDSRDGAD